MKKIAILLLGIILVSCSQEKKQILGETEYQKELKLIFSEHTHELYSRCKENNE